MNNTHTSLKLSKLLAENGCEFESEYIFKKSLQTNKISFGVKGNGKHAWSEVYPAYDILNDLCVKYVKEMFEGSDDPNDDRWGYQTSEILSLLQQGKKQEAEDYIWEHCKFNPKHKEI